MNNAPARSDLLFGRARQLVRGGLATDFRKACSAMAKRAAAAKKRRREARQRAAQMWYNRDT
jgi:hypothetical protein